MIAATQITSTDILTFIAVLVFILLSHKILFINRKNNRNFAGNYKKLDCEIFRVLLKRVSVHLSVLFQFA